MKSVFLSIFSFFSLFLGIYSSIASEITKDVTNNSVSAISDVLNTAFGGAKLVLPVQARSKNSTIRVGAVHTGINDSIKRPSRNILFHNSSQRSCAPSSNLLAANLSYELIQIQYDFEASGGINLEIKDIFTLLSLEASNIQSYSLKIRDASIVSSVDNVLRNEVGVLAMFDDQNDDWCKKAVFCGPKRTYILNSIAEGKIEMKFIFKQTANGKLVDFVIESIGAKVGANLNLTRSVTADGKEMAVFSSGENIVAFAATQKYWRKVLTDRTCS